jgi:F-type H+-transporting ATPase subunit gamma
MTRVSELQDRIGGLGDLLDIVGALRSLAGMRLQESQRALPGIRRYSDLLADAIGSGSALMPSAAAAQPAGGRCALVLCAAEHGFVGGFNERLVEAALAAVPAPDLLMVLGSRGAALATERGTPPAWASPMATRLAGAVATVTQLSTELYRRLATREISRVEVMHSRYRQGGGSTIERRTLLPLDPAALAARQARQAPLHNLAPRSLLQKLIAEHVFARLAEAAVESIASENAARFAAMDSAHEHVARKLSELRLSAHQAQQAEITAELLDLVTGGTAIAGSRPAPPAGRP